MLFPLLAPTQPLSPSPRLPVNEPTGSTYFMDIYVRHPLVLPLIRHHDYVYREITPDGQVIHDEMNWGWNAAAFDPRHPLASLYRAVPGKLSTVEHSEEQARRTPTITRHYQVPITQEAFRSAIDHINEIKAGQRSYTAIPHGLPGTDNCITAGLPQALGPMRPGIGMFAAPRIIRAMDRQNLIVR